MPVNFIETGYDSISLANGTRSEIELAKDKLNTYEPVIATDEDRIIYKDNNGELIEIGYGTQYKEDTVTALKSKRKYKLGDIVFVSGFHVKGDGSHHLRIAKSTDDGSGELGVDGLIWCIVHDGEVNLSWFGVKPYNESTDESDTIQKIMTVESIKTVNMDLLCWVKKTINVSKSIISNTRDYPLLVNNTGILVHADCVGSGIKVIYDDVEISNLRITDYRNNPTSYTVDLRGQHTSKFINNFISGVGVGLHNFGVICGPDGSSNVSFVSKLQGNRFSKATLELTGTDNYVLDNEIWANERNNAMIIRGSSNIIKDNQLVGGGNGAILIDRPGNVCQYLQINDNYFDGSYNELNTGHCIRVTPTTTVKASLFNSNWTYQQNGGFIYSQGTIDGCTIDGNVFDNNDSADLGISEIDSSILQSTNISNNIFSRNEIAPKTGLNRTKLGTLLTVHLGNGNNTFNNNICRTNNTYLSPSISNANVLFTGNIGELFADRNRNIVRTNSFTSMDLLKNMNIGTAIETWNNGNITNTRYNTLGSTPTVGSTDISQLDTIHPSSFISYAPAGISGDTGFAASMFIRHKATSSYEQILSTGKDGIILALKENNVWSKKTIVWTTFANQLDTPYYTRKMEEEGIYEDFVDYMDSLNTNPLARPSEPQPSERLLEFAKRYNIN